MVVRRVCIVLLSIVAALLLCSRAHAAAGSRHAPPVRPAPASCHRERFRVIIDVGHTVEIPGAISARGVPEYQFNLDLAKDIDHALRDAGFSKAVLLITAKPPPLGLVERALRANRMGANLFLAIHHDSVPADLLETWDYEGKTNHYNDRFSGYALFVSKDNGDLAGSLLFGRFLGTALQARGLRYTHHYTLPLMGTRRRELVDPQAGVYRYDQLIVLQDTRMPALLLEAGSIVNRQEELELASPQRRALVGAAVTNAVKDFCAARAGHRPGRAR